MSILNIFDFKPKLKIYADELTKALAQEGYTDWRFDPEQQTLFHGDGSIMNLVNLHTQYAAARRADRPALVDHAVAVCLSLHMQPPKDWSKAAEGLRLVVRSRYDMASMEVDADNPRTDVRSTVSWPLGGDLIMRLVYDFGRHVSHVATEHMETWGEPESVVKTRAMDNLAALPVRQWKELAADVFQIDPDIEFAESRMLLASVIARLPFKDRVAVIAPNRSILLAADSGSDDAMTTMLNEAIRCLQYKPWPMSGNVFIRQGDQWQMLERDGEIGKLLHVLDTLNMAGIYRDQKAAIESHNESIGRDVYVATFSVIERDGSLSSWSAWTEDCVTLLPVTDVVVLGRHNGQAEPSEHLSVAWEDLRRVMGAKMHPNGFNPPCYFVDFFPDDAQWEELRKRGLEL